MKVYTIATPGTRIVCRRGGIYAVKKSGERVLIPPDTDIIVIASSRVGLSSKVVRLAARRGIDIVFLDYDGSPVARIYTPTINKTIFARVQQYKLFQLDYGRRLAKEFVYSKIVNQAEVLRYLAKNYRDPAIREYAYQVDGVASELKAVDPKLLDRESLMAYESRAARIYWQAVSYMLPQELGFKGRDHSSKDPFNMALNYGYGILYNVCEKALVLAGLDPYLGVLHTPKSGKESLTFDFTEMFRAIAVDKPLILDAKRIRFEFSGDRLDYETRKSVAAVVTENLRQRYMYGKINRREELGEIIKKEAWDLAQNIREGSEYRGFRVVL